MSLQSLGVDDGNVNRRGNLDGTGWVPTQVGAVL